MVDSKGKVLIVDDEPVICKLLSHLTGKNGFKPLTAPNAADALEKIVTENPDVLLTDIMMPDVTGIELLRQVKEINPDLPVIMITAHADIPGAVEAIRFGAYDYLSKPFQNAEVISVLNRALEERKLKREARILFNSLTTENPLRRLMGPSEVMGQLISELNLVARSNFSVILFGETGTGKELIAKAIHDASGRSKGAFIAVDCGAIPESLFESELFGHKKGSFTGAGENKIGKFEAAHDGTLFLDEISNMPLGSQAKLLRVVQEKKVCPLGSTNSVRVNARIVAASNQNLRKLTVTGSFREDLFFRLSEYVLHIPPLRERKADIPYLAKLFLESTNQELLKNVSGFTEEAMQVLLRYGWPGNVRELRSVVRRAVLVAKKLIAEKHLNIKKMRTERPKLAPKSHAAKWDGESLKKSVRKLTIDAEREILTKVLSQTKGNKAEAARLLKIDYKTILTKLREYNIVPNGEQNGQEKEHE